MTVRIAAAGARDAIALARAHNNNDQEAVIDLLATLTPHEAIDLIVAATWLLHTTINQLADHTGISVDQYYQHMLNGITNAERDLPPR